MGRVLHACERSPGFSLHGDWFTVYTNHRPSFFKPPLPYRLPVSWRISMISSSP
ncbi:hypothetical protein TVNIR_0283 [Thioalkalivibrio nitratireducens DSM 14787]|uniref:Uncharacterized protein n=1 Tax=Thioalkalivibrio nitratireducens (strain DSM 14787 / UNIQEM 213 / ALEN2) TaxID=1255043 RepID=L0DQY7_THIND|nr:hypothetical protein TVNIR_0283 [Thioalkalivibrio nitratireducens DSM 14787]